MVKKRANAIKDVLDRNGCNYEIEKKAGQITFSLEDKYNKLTSSCPTHFIITVNRRGISVCGVLAAYVQEDYRLTVSRLLMLLNRDLREETESSDEIMFDMDIREGIVGIRCTQAFALWRCPDELHVAAMISWPIYLMDGCGGEILAVANGEKSAEEAYEDIANADYSSVSVGFLKDI
ncbi:MAG: hypothetical protein NC124_20705 [Clostridium sp.]|nr:hypothetical protein [Clostridium sp.]MCM1540415.1 hypothetical protein [Blautia sp.]